MAQSVLGSITLGYRPLWNRARTLAAVQLMVTPEEDTVVDGLHLLRTIQELWNAGSPPILLTSDSEEMISDLLQNAGPEAPMIGVKNEWLGSNRMRQLLLAAHTRGMKLVAHGTLDRRPDAQTARFFERLFVTLTPVNAASALNAAQQAAGAKGRAPSPYIRQDTNPLLAGQMYEGVASRALALYALDERQAWAVAGWPIEDIIHGMQREPLEPPRELVNRISIALDGEQSMEKIEQLLGEDPLLVHRLLVYVNSAALGLRTGMGSVRHSLMMLGYSSLKTWLASQLPHATEDRNLEPVRRTMVMRARLMEYLMDAGIEDDLRKEIYLCGLFSQLDLLLDDNLGSILHRLPLSDRIYSATVTNSGPYASSLEIAVALEGGDADKIRSLSQVHETGLEEINRSLLRMLAAARR